MFKITVIHEIDKTRREPHQVKATIKTYTFLGFVYLTKTIEFPELDNYTTIWPGF